MIAFEKTGKFDFEDPDVIYGTVDLAKKIAEINENKG